ncbi:MAG: bifunctional glutamate N-acetyltransferase/amino-acid acetyltransferase ArgJ [Pseudomonadota bacterium]
MSGESSQDTDASIAGVRLATVEAGIRYPDRRDLVAIAFDEGVVASAVFTRNVFCAAPVQIARDNLTACGFSPKILLINTGNANAGTGDPGLKAAMDCCQAVAEQARVPVSSVLPFSTGVIGEDLPVDRITDALPSLVGSLAADGWSAAAEGILTTDTRPKLRSRSFGAGGCDYRITGIAKGSGMIRPDMATMLAFIATDAPIAQSLLDECLREAVAESFHRVTVDGDTSTNDAVLVAATGAAGGSRATHREEPLAQAFFQSLRSLCVELAQELVRDGEGASKFVEVAVEGGRNSQECLDVAFTVAHSPLVKTALFAEDPNWGRVLAAIGRAGVEDLDIDGVRLSINDVLIAEKGARALSYDEAVLTERMSGTDLRLLISLGRGDARDTVWTTDFSYDYVRINAEYRS